MDTQTRGAGVTTIVLPYPHPAQQTVLQEAKRFNVVVCGRRWGKTDMGVTGSIETALDGKYSGWFAPTYKFTQEAWERHIELLPEAVIASVNKTDGIIKLITGGHIHFWTMKQTTKGKSMPGRGRAYHRVNIDEAAFAATLESDWTKSIRPTLSDYRGIAWFYTTPHGRDYVHRLWTYGQDGKKDWASWTMPTATNPCISAEEIADAKEELPGDAFSQEYEAAFLADAANPFGLTHIANCMQDELAEGPVEAWGFDLAKSYDWTVGIGLNAAGNVCAIQRWQADWRNTMARITAMVGNTPALIDSTGVGNPIVEQIQAKCPYAEGYTFSNKSKQELFMGLAVTIQSGDFAMVEGSAEHPTVLRNELESFIYEYRSSGVYYIAPEGCHDDCFPAGTPILTRLGWMAIEDVEYGDFVLTRDGWRMVAKAWCTGDKEVIERFGIRATASHRIWTENRGYVALNALEPSDTLVLCLKEKPSSSTAGAITDTPIPVTSISDATTGRTTNGERIHGLYTETSGRQPMAQSLTTTLSIMETETRSTTPSITWNAFPRMRTSRFMHQKLLRGGRQQSDWHTWTQSETNRKHGTDLRRDENGTVSMLANVGSELNGERFGTSSAKAVGRATKRCGPARTGIARRHVANARGAGDTELDSVLGRQPTYNLTVEGTHEYFANGVLVSNCVDSLALAVMCYKRMPQAARFSVATMSDEEQDERWFADPAESDDMWEVC